MGRFQLGTLHNSPLFRVGLSGLLRFVLSSFLKTSLLTVFVAKYTVQGQCEAQHLFACNCKSCASFYFRGLNKGSNEG